MTGTLRATDGGVKRGCGEWEAKATERQGLLGVSLGYCVAVGGRMPNTGLSASSTMDGSLRLWWGLVACLLVWSRVPTKRTADITSNRPKRRF